MPFTFTRPSVPSSKTETEDISFSWKSIVCSSLCHIELILSRKRRACGERGNLFTSMGYVILIFTTITDLLLQPHLCYIFCSLRVIWQPSQRKEPFLEHVDSNFRGLLCYKGFTQVIHLGEDVNLCSFCAL